MNKNIKVSKLLNFLKISINLENDFLINNLTNLDNAKTNDISFCSKPKYVENLRKTKASACLILRNFSKYVPNRCLPIISKNPELDFLKISNFIFKDFLLDKISYKYLKINEIK